jgi:hypothetical protein
MDLEEEGTELFYLQNRLSNKEFFFFFLIISY